MISFDDALRVVIDHARPLDHVSVPLADADGLHLAADVRAPFPLPRFDSSAVDGFAVKLHDVSAASADVPVPLPVSRTVRAGDYTTDELPTGQAWRVMSGAALPPSVDAVVMKEYCDFSTEIVAIKRAAGSGENIRRAGEEHAAGDIVLRRSMRISPPVIGELATLGSSSVAVVRPPRVSIIVTGDELRMPHESLGPGQIYDSNGPALLAACRRLGVAVCTSQRCSDDRALTIDALRSAIGNSDIVITVGGASVGDFDFVGDALHELGVTIHYTKVSMKPGKPNVFGTAIFAGRTVLVFGLPGNPVSALLSFHLLVRPAVRVAMGARNDAVATVSAILSQDIRKKPGRLEFVRVTLRHHDGQFTATPVAGQESHMLSGLCAADGLLRVTAETECLARGSVVDVERISW
jgi:molybdopterin molybdotransferase